MNVAYKLLQASVLLVSLAACGDSGSGPSGRVASITLSPSADTILIKSSQQITATIRDADGTPLSDVPVTWATSDESLATVSASGLVTALAPGAVAVTASADGKSATATLTLAPVVAIAPRLPSLFAQDTTQLFATLSDEEGGTLPGTVSWSSESPGIAGVTPNGVITGEAPGTARIVAISSGGRAEADAVVLSRTPRPTRLLAMFHPTERFDGMSITELVTMQADGSDVQRVTPADENVSDYAWARDGSAIAVFLVPGSLNGEPLYGRWGLYAMDPDGANFRLVAPGAALTPDWSPDGQRIAFATGRAIRTVQVNGLEGKTLTSGDVVDVLPRWSPDGRRIAWRRDGEYCGGIWVMDADGSHQQQVPLPAPLVGCTFAWSPDGKWIAVNASLSPNQPAGVWLLKSDGSSARPVGPSCVQVGACTTPPAAGAAWSPDGTRVAYVQAGMPSIVVTTVDGSSATTLDVPASCCAPPLQLAWTPDGQQLAFQTIVPATAEIGTPVIGLIALAGSPAAIISPSGEPLGNMSWQP